MSGWAFWDWVSYGGIVIAAGLIALDTAIAQSDLLRRYVSRPFTKPLIGFVPAIALCCSLAVFLFQQTAAGAPYAAPVPAQSFIQGWGVNGPVFYSIVDGRSVKGSHKLKRLLLIVRTENPTADRMSDIYISKSQAYSVEEGLMNLALASPSNILTPVGQRAMVQFNVATIPSLYSPDQVLTLGDVEKLGGEILGSASTLVEFSSSSSSPITREAACPPSIAR